MTPASNRKFLVLLIATFIALQIPFLGAAFRIDEPNIIRIGQQAARAPADPYGFRINWVGRDEDAFDILANPPGVPLWLAGTGRLLGWSEVALHAAMLPFALLAMIGFWMLATELGADPRMTLLLAASSPALFLASHVVMPDIAMLAMMNLAVACAFRYRRTGSLAVGAAGVVCGALAPLLKYNGVIAGAVIGAIWLLSRERRKGLFVMAAAPGLGLLLWSAWSLAVYGRVHILVIAEFESEGVTTIFSALVAYVGLALLPIAAWMPRAPRENLRWMTHAITAGGLLLMWAGAAFILELGLWSSLAYGLSAAVAFRYGTIAVMLGIDWIRARDVDGIVLFLWIVIGLWFQFGLLFASARYLLPLLPPALLLILRARLIDVRGTKAAAAVAVSLVLSVSIAIGDARIANLSRDFVREVVEPERAKSKGRFFFDGHWGFQYYCEEAGGVILNYWKQERWQDGDFVAIAKSPFPSHTRPQPGRGLTFEGRLFERSPGWPIRTIDCSIPANFHGPGLQQCRGPVLPWGIGSGPTDEFEIFVAAPRVRETAATP